MNNKFYLLVVGSREITNYSWISRTLDRLIKECANGCEIEVVSGGARGVDSLAERYADEHNLAKHVMKADWDKYGKKAGYIRNEEMHKYISQFDHKLCVAFWDGKSHGTAHNFKLAPKYNNPITIFNL